jgi:hypothetical protein
VSAVADLDRAQIEALACRELALIEVMTDAKLV